MQDLESKTERLQRSVFALLEPEVDRPYSLGILNWGLLVLILLNVLAVILESIESIRVQFGAFFQGLLLVSMLVFTVEYVLRVWTCPLHPSGLYKKPIRGRVRYILSPLPIIDLAAILPFWLGTIVGLDLRFLRLFRLLWILKIARFLPAVATLRNVLKRERRTLVAVFSLMLIILFIASSLVYLFEHDRQPEAFASIPHAMWWGMATLTTVGYGDLVPQTMMGKILGIIIMMLGIGTFALPAGILASAFSEESKRKNFMLSWDLVAKVPFFSHLNAQEIAEIASLLRPRTASANEVIFKKDDEADSIFFIVSGEVEVQIEPEPIHEGRGDFFGEVALLYHRKRTASVVAMTHLELLELDAKDFHRAFDARPGLRQRIVEQAEKRFGSSAEQADPQQ